MRALLAGLGALALALVAPAPAAADDLAPALETLELQKKAQAELKKLVAGLAEKDQRRLVGLYLAFDANASDPSAMVACDDDGDYVIVMTDAMAKLLANVARAQSFDEANSGRTIEDYAAFLARTQVPGRRLLPLPPGSFTAMKEGTTEDTRLREALSFVLARELSHFRAGDLVCPHPTATHERGDDEWTPQEQRKAMEAAATIYPGGHATTRDSEATVRVLDAGRTEDGALGALRFFAQLEVERTVHVSRFMPTYLLQHPSANTRAGAVKVAAHTHRSQ